MENTIRELNAVVMPNGAIQLEYGNDTTDLSKSADVIQTEIYNRYLSTDEDWLLFLGFYDKEATLSPSLEFWRQFAGAFVRDLSRTPDLEDLRQDVRIPVREDGMSGHLARAPLMTGSEYLNFDVLVSMWERLNVSFSRSISAFQGTVGEFIGTYSKDVHVAGRVYFHLVENKSANLPFAFLATYATRLDKQGKSKHLPLGHALREYGRDGGKLLELLVTVHRAAKNSALITDLLESGELFHPLAWTAGDAFTFLKEISVYEDAGVLCRIPDWWKGKRSGVGVRISVGDGKPSYIGMDAILNFNARLFLGDTEITEAEARCLLEESEGLAFIKNKWVAADPEKVRRTLELYENAKKLVDREGVTLTDALRFQLRPEKFLAINDGDDVAVENGEWLDSVMQKLRNPAKLPPVKLGQNFKATLRPYQEKGLGWLWFLHTLRFGACLADDMGLGKTVQLLGFLSAMKYSDKTSDSQNTPSKTSLLIIPASLIANWVGEIGRFFPDLNIYVAHPQAHRSGSVKKKSEKDLDRLDLVITTYALIQKYEWLHSYKWTCVVLDEAQAIKNPGTKQTRAVKKLSAENRIAMTGTPIENRLTDLWSLFDFLNPGLLGTSREFSDFAKTMKNHPDGYSRLRKIVSPYILRRLKTDKTVINDLPDKVEMKTYAALGKKQVVLYQNLVDDIREIIEKTDGIQRRGLILASLMKFKQICNHPDQYKGTGDFDAKHSGKFERLGEICETIREKREKALIFTQFREITEPLGDFLTNIFGREGLVFHGSVPVGKRKKIIERFQSGEYVPFMVLSIKAGGVGLNLTEANHVIHFDRWWNPAVENQATDRAFRIGQKKNVMVHKFLTRGTIEEKIDKMLEEKSKLSQEVIAETGEKWITEMENNELMDLFRLSI